MDWIWDRVDRLLAAAVVAVCGAFAAQLNPLIVQYLDRAAAVVTVAEEHLRDVQTGLKYQVMADVVRRDAERQAQDDVARARAAHDPIARAGIVMQPFRLLDARDPQLFEQTAAAFVPAMPDNRRAIIYTVLGALAGFIGYEFVRLLALKLFIEERKRRFRRR
ncbi:MAG: DUF2937 family protein, partial [Rhodobacteraceae bacterium]|nr:DUF2937 family protein [Paracoccaceae bacterium]